MMDIKNRIKEMLNEVTKDDNRACMIVLYYEKEKKEYFIGAKDKIVRNQNECKFFKFKDALKKRNEILIKYDKIIKDSQVVVKIMYSDSAPTPGTNPLSN